MSKINLFLDSSALFAGIVSPSGAARALLMLAETEHISIMISEQVLTETERAITRKIPSALNDVRLAILNSKAQIVHDPSKDQIQKHLYLIKHAADVPIVLAAMSAKLDFLVTLNRRHFIDDPHIARRSGLRIGTPGDALIFVRQQLSSQEQ